MEKDEDTNETLATAPFRRNIFVIWSTSLSTRKKKKSFCVCTGTKELALCLNHLRLLVQRNSKWISFKKKKKKKSRVSRGLDDWKVPAAVRSWLKLPVRCKLLKICVCRSLCVF